jgi:hypothetical protein
MINVIKFVNGLDNRQSAGVWKLCKTGKIMMGELQEHKKLGGTGPTASMKTCYKVQISLLTSSTFFFYRLHFYIFEEYFGIFLQ